MLSYIYASGVERGEPQTLSRLIGNGAMEKKNQKKNRILGHRVRRPEAHTFLCKILRARRNSENPPLSFPAAYQRFLDRSGLKSKTVALKMPPISQWTRAIVPCISLTQHARARAGAGRPFATLTSALTDFPPPLRLDVCVRAFLRLCARGGRASGIVPAGQTTMIGRERDGEETKMLGCSMLRL
jgi:hypothetical protein